MSTASCFRQLTRSYPDLPALMFLHSLIPVWLRHASAAAGFTVTLDPPRGGHLKPDNQHRGHAKERESAPVLKGALPFCLRFAP